MFHGYPRAWHEEFCLSSVVILNECRAAGCPQELLLFPLLLLLLPGHSLERNIAEGLKPLTCDKKGTCPDDCWCICRNPRRLPETLAKDIEGLAGIIECSRAMFVLGCCRISGLRLHRHCP